MAEKPIIFSVPMVRAIKNTKPDTWPPEPIDPAKPFKWMTRRMIKPQPDITHNLPVWRFRNTKTDKETKCPYGPPGTVLWVRETWAILDGDRHFTGTLKRAKELGIAIPEAIHYRADAIVPNLGPWRPAIHMPKEAARLFLLVKDVRVERLQDITEEDAIAEGVQRDGDGWKSYDIIQSGPHKGKGHPWNVFPYKSAILSFQSLWDSINGKKYIIHEWEDDDGVIHKEKIEASYPWESNPWVWVVSFMRTKGR